MRAQYPSHILIHLDCEAEVIVPFPYILYTRRHKILPILPNTEIEHDSSRPHADVSTSNQEGVTATGERVPALDIALKEDRGG